VRKDRKGFAWGRRDLRGGVAGVGDGVSSIAGDALCIDRTSGNQAPLLLGAMLAFRRSCLTFRDIFPDL